jgi:RNA polymerase subunit RPABC4/transcription elongation factor Spt4
MAEKQKVCKNCGHMTLEKQCPLCKGNSFAEKPKGKVVIFDKDTSEIAKKADIEHNGSFAIKY